MSITIAQVGALGRRRQENGWDLLATILVSGNESESRGHLKASSGLCTCVHSLHTSRHTRIRKENPPVLGPREGLCLGGDIRGETWEVESARPLRPVSDGKAQGDLVPAEMGTQEGQALSWFEQCHCGCAWIWSAPEGS